MKWLGFREAINTSNLFKKNIKDDEGKMKEQVLVISSGIWPFILFCSI